MFAVVEIELDINGIAESSDLYNHIIHLLILSQSHHCSSVSETAINKDVRKTDRYQTTAKHRRDPCAYFLEDIVPINHTDILPVSSFTLSVTIPPG